MNSTKFAHLHVHTEYSFLSSLCRIEKLVERAGAYRMPALAVTDRANLCGAVEFYGKALEAGIKPIIGCEVFVVTGIGAQDEENSPFHLTLLSKNYAGYKNLIRISTAGYLSGSSRKPRISKNLLKERPEGLVILSGCAESEISRALLSGNRQRAFKTAMEYRDIAGDDFYLEIQHDGGRETKMLAKELVKLSEKTKIPPVATNNCRYIEKKDAEFYELLSRLAPEKKNPGGGGCTLNPRRRWRKPSGKSRPRSQTPLRSPINAA